MLDLRVNLAGSQDVPGKRETRDGKLPFIVNTQSSASIILIHDGYRQEGEAVTTGPLFGINFDQLAGSLLRLGGAATAGRVPGPDVAAASDAVPVAGADLRLGPGLVSVHGIFRLGLAAAAGVAAGVHRVVALGAAPVAGAVAASATLELGSGPLRLRGVALGALGARSEAMESAAGAAPVAGADPAAAAAAAAMTAANRGAASDDTYIAASLARLGGSTAAGTTAGKYQITALSAGPVSGTSNYVSCHVDTFGERWGYVLGP